MCFANNFGASRIQANRLHTTRGIIRLHMETGKVQRDWPNTGEQTLFDADQRNVVANLVNARQGRPQTRPIWTKWVSIADSLRLRQTAVGERYCVC